MKIILLIFFIIQSFLFSWNNKNYQKYNYKSFARLVKANQKIDMSNINYQLLNAAIFFETCRQRILNNLKPFKYSPALEKSAFEHSKDMVKYNFFSHTSLVRGKESMGARLFIVGITNAYSSENIADIFGIQYQSGVPIPQPKDRVFKYQDGTVIQKHTYLSLAKSFLNGWMNSPGHRINILNPKYHYLGCGAYHYINSKFYNIDMFKATQNFSSIKGKKIN